MAREQRSAKSQCSPSSREAVNVAKSATRRQEKLMVGGGVVGDWSLGGILAKSWGRRSDRRFRGFYVRQSLTGKVLLNAFIDDFKLNTSFTPVNMLFK